MLDGQALAFSTGRRLLVWATGGILEVHRVGQGRPTGITFDWSDAAQAFAIGNLGSERLILAFADGSRSESGIEGAYELAWSPDGRRLHAAYPAHTGDAVLHALLTTERGTIEPIDIGSGVTGWLDNDTLIVGSLGSNGGYDRFDIPSETRQPWSDASTETFGLMNQIGYAPGLTGLALFANSGSQATPQDLVVQDLPSGEIHVLGTRLFPPFNAVGRGTWSPDGTRIAVSLEGAADDPRLVPGLWLYSLAGGDPIQLVSTFTVRVSNGAWGPQP